MRTRRGLLSTTLAIVALIISAYFGFLGRKTVLTPESTLSQILGEVQKAPETNSVNVTQQVQVVVPPEPKKTTPPSQPPEQLPQRAANPDEVLVKRVVDGDTVELASGEKVRLIGIDTPETVDPRKSVQCFGKEAKEFTRSLLENQWVRLETDIEPKDKYGRTLAYVYRDELFVNDTIIREGYAHVMTIPPNVRYAEVFRESQQFARVQNKGLWSACED